MTVAPEVQAHRGSPDPSQGVVENTLEAFIRARRLGADSVELDARLTADGGLCVHHDPVIEGAGLVHLLATADLPAHVPLLGDALEACAGMAVNVEIKNLPPEPAFDPDELAARAVVELVLETGRQDSVSISSFWSGALAAVRATGAGIPTALLVLPSFTVADSVAAAIDLGCAGLNLPLGLVDAAAVAAARSAGLSVAAWTVEDRAGLDAVLAAGVDTVITDDVALARSVIDSVIDS